MELKALLLSMLALSVFQFEANAQITERKRPEEWKSLVYGGRFMDRFQPMPATGKLTYDTWGADNVIPRYVDNGIESNELSFWGGNIIPGDDGKYHFYVCGWPEDSPKGHGTWPRSTVYHAVADNSIGPFTVKDTIGLGHNPEAFRLSDGRYVIYVIDGRYIADGPDGPWEYSKFEFDERDRPIHDGLSNQTFAQREDGSYLMVNRGGGVWFSQTGISPYKQVTVDRVYPAVEGNFEDPVVWRSPVQYHMIVNDWLGRIAYYLRSMDGVNWKVEPGEAYMPGIAKHVDGTVEDWFKYERIKILQDEKGRATQANFAVIDVAKKEDKGDDNHSSKNISIPLTVERLLTILDKEHITASTKTIRVKIAAENGFNPHTDIDINSLRFGASEEVNFGRGSTVMKTEKSGDDLIITFNGAGNGIRDEFAAKLLGKTSEGKLLFGYARLPWVDYKKAILSASMPEITANGNGSKLNVEVQNFGQSESKVSSLIVLYLKDGQEVQLTAAKLPKLKPFEKTNVELNSAKVLEKGVEYDIKVLINPDDKNPSTLQGKVKAVEE